MVKVSKQQECRDEIVRFFRQEGGFCKAATVRHFTHLGVGKSTTYRVLQKFIRHGHTERSLGSGRRGIRRENRLRNRIVKLSSYKVGVSTRSVAEKVGVSQSTVTRVQRDANLRYFKRKKTSAFLPGQEERARQACVKLSKELRPSDDKVIVMDDESYFHLSNSDLPGNIGFFGDSSAGPSAAPDSVRYRGAFKFPTKVMMWIAISPKGISEPLFMPSKHAMKGEHYREECVKKRLQPFIERVHGDDNIMFWPDLASAHYAKETQQLLHNLHIPFVSKICNPPNVPHLRPIERFWGILKQKVYRGGWEAENIPQLKRKIKKELREFDHEVVRKLFSDIKSKIRKSGDDGVRSTL